MAGTVRTDEHHGVMALRIPRLACVASLLAVLAACTAPGATRSLTLHTLNDSGVSGTVTLTAVGSGTTRVVVDVNPAGHPNMPAHIHPGTCGALTPQPEFPLQNIVNGRSTTDIIVPLDDLFADAVALNIHASNEEMQTYTACVDLH
jgi:hypothetical protein